VTTGVADVQYLSGQGVYRACLSAAATLTLTAAHATLDRIDLVYLRVWDNSVDASGLNQADAVYLAGTPSSTPVAPTPAGTQIYIPLATITVPHSGSGSPSVSTAVLNYTVAPGGILPSSSAPSTPYTGQYYDNGTNLLRYNGSTWDTYQKMTGAWTSWTPTWSTTTGSHLPSFGNATVDCRYSKLGRTVLYTMNITFGSTTNFGSGVVGADNWIFSLPFTAAVANYPIGTTAFAPGTSKGAIGIAQTSADGLTLQLYMAGATAAGAAVASGIADSISPYTWASGDRFTVTGQYEATT
jgi:hypothetical protein